MSENANLDHRVVAIGNPAAVSIDRASQPVPHPHAVEFGSGPWLKSIGLRPVALRPRLSTGLPLPAHFQ